MFYKQNLFQADTHLRRIKTKHSFLSERICRKKFEVLLYELWKEGSAILILIVRALVVMFCCCLGKKLSTLISCEQALHLGDKVKTGRARGTREETRKRGVGVVGVALARLSSFAQIGELARRLVRLGPVSYTHLTLPTKRIV